MTNLSSIIWERTKDPYDAIEQVLTSNFNLFSRIKLSFFFMLYVCVTWRRVVLFNFVLLFVELSRVVLCCVALFLGVQCGVLCHVILLMLCYVTWCYAMCSAVQCSALQCIQSRALM